jgi:predicted transcriptional regulator
MKKKTKINGDSLEKAHQNALHMTTSQRVGFGVRDRRKFLRLRQRDLAELAGVTLRGLTALENGLGNPTLNQLAKIADVLGMAITLSERSSHAAG